ncbi:ExbD/TolR family protein, partial [Xanthomonas phaseoli]
VDLPQATHQPRVPLEPPAPLALRLDADGQLFWNASPVTLLWSSQTYRCGAYTTISWKVPTSAIHAAAVHCPAV